MNKTYSTKHMGRNKKERIIWKNNGIRNLIAERRWDSINKKANS